ncbi:hypothetical protein ACVWWG_002726 [Bradyrhizobium sp. LB7.2]
MPLLALAALLPTGGACLSGAGCGLAAILVKSPALLSPSAFTLVAQLARAAITGPVEVRSKFRTARPAVATIRLAFWNVRTTLAGMTAVSMFG